MVYMLYCVYFSISRIGIIFPFWDGRSNPDRIFTRVMAESKVGQTDIDYVQMPLLNSTYSTFVPFLVVMSLNLASSFETWRRSV